MDRRLAGMAIIVTVLLLACADASAEWEASFGNKYYDYGHSVCQTNDGGFIVAGRTRLPEAEDCDIWLIKTDANGNKLWDKTYGGAAHDDAYCVKQTTDGGYIILGFTISYGAGQDDVYLIKTDAAGTVEWDTTFGGPGGEYAWTVHEIAAGGYVIIGYSDSFGVGRRDVWLIKTDAGGNMLWDQTYGGPWHDYGWDVEATSDGGYVIVGQTYSYGEGKGDVWLLKTDSNGAAQWDTTFGGEKADVGHSVVQVPDGGYLIAGTTDSFSLGRRDLWLIKTDSYGDMLWNKTFGGDAIDGGWKVRIRPASDGGFLILGDTHSFGAGASDAWVIKIDDEGNEKWNRTFGGSWFNHARDIQPTDDGGYIFTGYSDPIDHFGLYDVWLVKADPLGLSALATAAPANESVLHSPPEFRWNANGGEGNYFAVDLALSLSGPVWSTHENLHETIVDSRWTVPEDIWNMIPPASYVFWRVRGLDRDAPRPTVVYSNEVWWFYKP